MQGTLDFSYADVDFDSIDVEQVRNNERLFYIIVAASFIESGTDKYTSNLIHLFADDAEVVSWLRTQWLPEELRHGQMLKRYVRQVWPEFDWEEAYGKFMAEYAGLCQLEFLESRRGLELAGRCVVEMGTTTYYEALRDMCDEPVLRHLTGLIRRDEIQHYKYFYRFFRQYNAREENGRISVLMALGRRLLEIRNADADCALWHIFDAVHPGQARDCRAFKVASSAVAALVQENYPTDRAVKMFLRPLDLPPTLAAVIQPVARLTQGLLL